MSQCQDAANIRARIERYVLCLFEADGTTLRPYTDWPGYYTITDTNFQKSLIPAVFIEGAQFVPTDWEPSGIECIIYETPRPNQLGGYGSVLFTEEWTVRLVNHGTTQSLIAPTLLNITATRLLTVFGSVTLDPEPRTELTLEALTARIRGVRSLPIIP